MYATLCTRWAVINIRSIHTIHQSILSDNSPPMASLPAWHLSVHITQKHHNVDIGLFALMPLSLVTSKHEWHVVGCRILRCDRTVTYVSHVGDDVCLTSPMAYVSCYRPNESRLSVIQWESPNFHRLWVYILGEMGG